MTAERTKTELPQATQSNEADQKQLALAKRQGAAYHDAVREMTKEGVQGGEQAAGDYVVGFAIEKAEGMYALKDAKLQWQEPKDENAHFEIVVRDAADGRFVPGLTVKLTVTDGNGNEVGTHEQPFLWHPWLHHYGRNWKIPGDGTYDLLVRIEPPTFMRHDPINGRRYEEPVEVEFRGIRVKTGVKKSNPPE